MNFNRNHKLTKEGKSNVRNKIKRLLKQNMPVLAEELNNHKSFIKEVVDMFEYISLMDFLNSEKLNDKIENEVVWYCIQERLCIFVYDAFKYEKILTNVVNAAECVYATEAAQKRYLQALGFDNATLKYFDYK